MPGLRPLFASRAIAAGACFSLLNLGFPWLDALALDLGLTWDAAPTPDPVYYQVFSRLPGELYDHDRPVCVTQTTSCLVIGLDARSTYYFVARAFLPPARYSPHSNETVYRPTRYPSRGASLPIAPTPTKQEDRYYDAPAAPVISADPAACQPLAIEMLPDGTLRLDLGLPAFDSPSDVYVGAYVADGHPDLYFLSRDDRWVNADRGWQKWMAQTFGDLETPLLEYRSLPAGTYRLGVLVAPAGRLDRYYLWQTEWVVD